MIYTSINNPKIKNLSKLKEKKFRDKENLYIIEGEHLVREAIKRGLIKEIFVLENSNLEFNNANYVSKEVMKYITNLDSIPPVIGLAYKEKTKEIGNKIVILENVQDPGNIGTIIRSAVAFNIDTLILTKGCADVYSPKVLRATQGMIFHINIINEEIENIIDKLKEKNIKILGTKVDNGKSLKTIEKLDKFAIIMGNEGNGVKKETLDNCDEYLYIDMNKNCESLNVGVATSIILYELDKKG